MKTIQAYRFALDLTPSQERAVLAYAGAARVAHNWALARVKAVTCSGCGTVKAKLALSEREYQCQACGLVLDRDLNAARNLAAVAAGYHTALLAEGLGPSHPSTSAEGYGDD